MAALAHPCAMGANNPWQRTKWGRPQPQPYSRTRTPTKRLARIPRVSTGRLEGIQRIATLVVFTGTTVTAHHGRDTGAGFQHANAFARQGRQEYPDYLSTRRDRAMRYLTLVMLALVLAIPNAAGQEKAPADALMLDVDGAIGPAVSDFVERSIERAAT